MKKINFGDQFILTDWGAVLCGECKEIGFIPFYNGRNSDDLGSAEFEIIEEPKEQKLLTE